MDRVDGLVAAASAVGIAAIRHQRAFAGARAAARVVRMWRRAGAADEREADGTRRRAPCAAGATRASASACWAPRARSARSTLDLIGRNPRPVRGRGADGQQQRRGAGRAGHAASGARSPCVADESGYGELKERLAGTGIEAAAGAAALIEAAVRPADCVMAGIIGAAGLRPTLAAVAQGRRVALANKECLVSAGEIFMEAVRSAGTELVPVDSEHSAVFQAIAGAGPGRHRAHRADGLGRAVPHLEPGAAGARHAGAGARASQLVDGAQDHHQLGDPDEQGPGADRGLSPVSRASRPSSRWSCIRNRSSMRWSAIATARCWRSWRAPTCARRLPLSLAWPARMAAPTKRIDLVELGT